MAHLQELLQWAEGRGVEIHGIQPCKIPGRGTGVVATRKLKAGDVVLRVPHGALRCLDTVSRDVRQKLPANTPIHGLLAADLVLDKGADLAPWKAVLPRLADFEQGMPLMWPEALQNLLPKQAKDYLEKQKARFHPQWAAFTKVFPDVPREEYLYAWLVMNTRTFYNETPETENYHWEDRLALLPVADLFNHAGDGCIVAYSPQGYVITADRAYRSGEEVYISYGEHPNDYILLEYGFIIDNNQWDEVYLDDVILPGLNASQKSELQDRGLLGKYPLGASSKEAHRTQVVLRLLSGTPEQWKQFADGKEKWTARQEQVDLFLVELLETFSSEILKTLGNMADLNAGQEAQRTLLTKRWKQIADFVRQAIKDRNPTV